MNGDRQLHPGYPPGWLCEINKINYFEEEEGDELWACSLERFVDNADPY
jgi:hypothetical protein